jgi:hypothetical protein
MAFMKLHIDIAVGYCAGTMTCIITNMLPRADFYIF